MRLFINKETKEILPVQDICILLNASIPESITDIGDWEVYTPTETKPDKSQVKEAEKVAAISRERGWREEELYFADIKINILEDDGLDASMWREYRKSLRKWPENKNFPKEKYRPKRPE